MTSPGRPGINLEPDTVSGRGAVLLAILFLAITVGGAFWAREIIDDETARLNPDTTGVARVREEQPAPTGRVNLTLIDYDSTALELQRSQRRSLERLEWVDSSAGIARIPIETAMTIIARRLGGDTRTDTLTRASSTPSDSTRPGRPAGTAGSDTAAGPGMVVGRGEARVRDGSGTGLSPFEAPIAWASLLPRRQATPTGGALAAAAVTERQGDVVPLDAKLVDGQGHAVRLGGWFDGQRPVLLVPGYYHCTMLCGLVLDGLARAIDSATSVIGTDYRVVSFSIDPRDTPATARQRRRPIAASVSEEDWAFLTGTASAVRRIADAIGFGYHYDEDSDQYAHAAVIVALTPDGRVSRYLYGIEFTGDDVDRAVRDAARGDTGSSLKRALLRCFHYTPALRRWAGLVAGSLRGGAVLVMIALGVVVALAVRAGRRHAATSAGAGAGKGGAP